MGVQWRRAMHSPALARVALHSTDSVHALALGHVLSLCAPDVGRVGLRLEEPLDEGHNQRSRVLGAQRARHPHRHRRQLDLHRDVQRRVDRQQPAPLVRPAWAWACVGVGVRQRKGIALGLKGASVQGAMQSGLV